MIEKQIKTIKDTAGWGISYGTDNGNFFLIQGQEATEMHSCREIFSGYFKSSTAIIGFSFSRINIKNLNEFFTIIEKKLKLKTTQKIKFFATTMKNVVYIEVPTFWRENNTRRQLFTLFLRAGAVHYKG